MNLTKFFSKPGCTQLKANKYVFIENCLWPLNFVSKHSWVFKMDMEVKLISQESQIKAGQSQNLHSSSDMNIVTVTEQFLYSFNKLMQRYWCLEITLPFINYVLLIRWMRWLTLKGSFSNPPNRVPSLFRTSWLHDPLNEEMGLWLLMIFQYNALLMQ